jgi:hypothetical protein
VNKTEYIYNLINKGVCCFLSRPRRFGKSLLLSAMDELFRCLWIDSSDYDFRKGTVLRLSMALDSDSQEELRKTLVVEIDGAARKKNGVIIQGDIPSNILKP